MRVIGPSGDFEVTLGVSIGRGGEGEVLRVAGRTDIVAKVIHPDRRSGPDSFERRSKLVAQIQSQPSSKFLCWPSGLLFDGDEWLGFVMPAVGIDALPWASFANFFSRSTQAPDFDLVYAMTSVINLCAAFETVHATGGVVGDVNESNVLVGADASVWVIDCDSQQFSSKNQIWFCTVGKEEFCAPELVGSDFKTTPRTTSSDVFGFAVLAFQMLSGGSHPFDAVPEDKDTDLEPLSHRIKHGLAPLFKSAPGIKAPTRVPIDAIPAPLLDIMRDSLLNTPEKRPTLAQWSQVLRDVQQNLQPCKKSSSHLSLSKKDCPWCRHFHSTGFDVWANPGSQQTLPSIGLKSRKEINVERRPSRAAPSNEQSVSFRSYLGLFAGHPRIAVRYFWKRSLVGHHLAPPATHSSGLSFLSGSLLLLSITLACLPLASLWFIEPQAAPFVLFPLLRWSLVVFGVSGVLFYLYECLSQSRHRLLSFTLHDLWRLPLLAVFSAVFWVFVTAVVVLDATHRAARYMYWLWRSN